MILIVDLNFRKDSLGFFEFVMPVVYAIRDLDKYVVKHYLELTSDDIKEGSSIIMPGTPLKDNVTLSKPEAFTWLRNCAIPVLGICAGMQTIAVTFGVSLERCLAIGMTRIKTTAPNPLFSSTFQAYTLHNYSLKSPKDFEVLATSEKCVQAIKHKSKNIYGVLFHPEVRNQEIIRRFVQTFRFTE